MDVERPITVQTKVGELLDTYPDFAGDHLF